VKQGKKKFSRKTNLKSTKLKGQLQENHLEKVEQLPAKECEESASLSFNHYCTQQSDSMIYHETHYKTQNVKIFLL